MRRDSSMKHKRLKWKIITYCENVYRISWLFLHQTQRHPCKFSQFSEEPPTLNSLQILFMSSLSCWIKISQKHKSWSYCHVLLCFFKQTCLICLCPSECISCFFSSPMSSLFLTSSAMFLSAVATEHTTLSLSIRNSSTRMGSPFSLRTAARM